MINIKFLVKLYQAAINNLQQITHFQLITSFFAHSENDIPDRSIGNFYIFNVSYVFHLRMESKTPPSPIQTHVAGHLFNYSRQNITVEWEAMMGIWYFVRQLLERNFFRNKLQDQLKLKAEGEVQAFDKFERCR